MPYTKPMHELAVFKREHPPIRVDDVAICDVAPNWLFVEMVPEVSTHGTTVLKMSADSLVRPGQK